MTSVADQMRIFDTLSSRRERHGDRRARRPAVADAPSLRDIGFLDAVKKGQLTFVVFHILGSSIASLNEIEEPRPSPPTPSISWSRTSSTTRASSSGTRPPTPRISASSRTPSRSPSRSSTRWLTSRSSSLPFRSSLSSPTSWQGRCRQLFLRVARLCPALARQRLGRVRPRQAQRDRGDRRRAGGTARTGRRPLVRPRGCGHSAGPSTSSLRRAPALARPCWRGC